MTIRQAPCEKCSMLIVAGERAKRCCQHVWLTNFTNADGRNNERAEHLVISLRRKKMEVLRERRQADVCHSHESVLPHALLKNLSRCTSCANVGLGSGGSLHDANGAPERV